MDQLPLPTLEDVDALSEEALPALLLELSALQSRAACRLLSRNGTPAPSATADRLLTIEEAAERLGTSKDWLWRHGQQLPFVVRLSEGQTRYSAKGLEAFIASRAGQ